MCLFPLSLIWPFRGGNGNGNGGASARANKKPTSAEATRLGPTAETAAGARPEPGPPKSEPGARYASNLLSSAKQGLLGHLKDELAHEPTLKKPEIWPKMSSAEQKAETTPTRTFTQTTTPTTTTNTTINTETNHHRAQASPGNGAERSNNTGAHRDGIDGPGGAADSFRIRTANRRHLDFDSEFDLADASAAGRSRWAGPFHFIQAADCQFGMIDSYVHHRTEPGWSEEIELCERLVALCNQMTPRPLFLVICGDLVDSLPTSEIGARQVADFKRIFARLRPEVPLVCVCGNHDVGDQPTPGTVADYRRTFGDDYFYFTKNDILFIVINSQFYQHRANVEGEARDQDRWLEAVLKCCRLFKYSILFEHIPWFLERPDEDDDYFNIRREVRIGWLEKFRAAGVTKIMCGHYHRNAGGWFQGMELVVTSAIGAQCGPDKSGVRIVKVLEDSIEHQYYAMQDVPLNVELRRSA